MDWGSVFNHVVDFAFWFFGCLHMIGCIGGLVFFYWVLYFGLKKSKRPHDEYRCEQCVDRIPCPAANSGVVYPCPYFEPKVVQHDK